MRIPQATRDAVKARSGGVCERCHSQMANHLHHRERVGMGGAGGERAIRLNQPGNLEHLCWRCHGREHT